MAARDSSPVYYREIQKNAYLKRIPDEFTGSKLRPLALKKPPLKPMWTQLCVHNGRTPYLEQYRDPVSARAHRPAWRASLVTARHVTASVTPRDNEYDFLIDTHHGPVRMLAPTWECMQDWVSTLRNKLHELKIVPLCENVYMSPPAAPPPRAAARDPTSPLPPTPPLPLDRVPGIDLTSVTRAPPIPETPPEPITPEPPPETIPDGQTTQPEIDISNWDDLSLPSTSQAPTSVAKICGQNICLDNSIFKRGADSDEDFVDTDGGSESSYRQTVLVGQSRESEELTSNRPSNITVIQVSNKDPPHTAIPVIGDETNIFNFEFKTTPISQNPDFVNIVNTEIQQNDYGTVFTGTEPDYGHLSLTTTVSLTGHVKDNEDLYERLCMASTKPSPLPVRRLRSVDKVRKSSLPNLNTVNSTYEYLFLSQNNNNCRNNSDTHNNITPISTNCATSTNITSVSTNITAISANSTPISGNSTPISGNSTPISANCAPISANSALISENSTPISGNSAIISANGAPISANSTVISANSTLLPTHNTPICTNGTQICVSTTLSNTSNVTVNSSTEINSNRHGDSITRGVGANIERTQSQNAYDASTAERNDSKTAAKVEKSEPQHKPIWKRGLTELSLLTRLRGIGQLKRPESPVRNSDNNERNGVTPPSKVVHRSRPEARDAGRRRSSSLSNGESPASSSVPMCLQPLLRRQAAAVRAAQRRGAACVACLPSAQPPLFADYNKQVWVAWWGAGGSRCAGRIGDRVCGIRASAPKDAAHAKQLFQSSHTRGVDILFHRVPLAKIYVVNKRDQESIGIKLDNECNIMCVETESAAARAGIPPAGKWAVTEVNNRPVNLIKGGEDDMNRISLHGTEASVLIQPSALVKKLRAALKGNKTLLGLR